MNHLSLIRGMHLAVGVSRCINNVFCSLITFMTVLCGFSEFLCPSDTGPLEGSQRLEQGVGLRALFILCHGVLVTGCTEVVELVGLCEAVTQQSATRELCSETGARSLPRRN